MIRGLPSYETHKTNENLLLIFPFAPCLCIFRHYLNLAYVVGFDVDVRASQSAFSFVDFMLLGDQVGDAAIDRGSVS